MKVTVFTSNQPRHVSLIHRLAAFADEVDAVVEASTIWPGKVDDFYSNSAPMRDYFTRVTQAEQEVFGPVAFTPRNVRILVSKLGDMSKAPLDMLRPALDADVFVVFGASYIKGELCEYLVDHGALNIHMGVSPYFRGSGCNFWALVDGRPDLVGATIHFLSKGLDSGPMLFHALPAEGDADGFQLGMLAVRAAHAGLVDFLSRSDWTSVEPVKQDKSGEIRYSRYSDFTDEVVEAYLGAQPKPEAIRASVSARDMSLFLRPFVG